VWRSRGEAAGGKEGKRKNSLALRSFYSRQRRLAMAAGAAAGGGVGGEAVGDKAVSAMVRRRSTHSGAAV
jgi:hypothetical protein